MQVHAHHSLGNIFDALVRVLAKLVWIEIDKFPWSECLDHERRVRCRNELYVREGFAELRDDLALPGGVKVKLEFINENNAVPLERIVDVRVRKSQTANHVAENRDKRPLSVRKLVGGETTVAFTHSQSQRLRFDLYIGEISEKNAERSLECIDFRTLLLREPKAIASHEIPVVDQSV